MDAPHAAAHLVCGLATLMGRYSLVREHTDLRSRLVWAPGTKMETLLVGRLVGLLLLLVLLLLLLLVVVVVVVDVVDVVDVGS